MAHLPKYTTKDTGLASRMEGKEKAQQWTVNPVHGRGSVHGSKRRIGGDVSTRGTRRKGRRSSMRNSLLIKAAGIIHTWASETQGFNERLREKRDQDRKIRRENLIIAFLSCLGFLLMIFDEEQRWSFGPQYIRGLRNTSIETPFHVLEALIPIVNLLLVWRLVVLYSILADIKQHVWGLSSSWLAFWSSSLKWKFLVELLLALIVPWPRVFYQYKFAGDSWIRHLGLLMTLRIYVFGRVVRDYSSVYVHRYRASRVSESYVKVGTLFALRAGLRKRPLTTLIMSTIVLCLMFGYCIMVMERESKFEGFTTNIDRMAEALWFTVATLTTVGYGDKFPSNSKGYVVAVAVMAVGVIITSFLVAVVIDKMTMSTDELRLYNWSRQFKKREKHKLIAISLIKSFFRYAVSVRRMERERTTYIKTGDGKAPTMRSVFGGGMLTKAVLLQQFLRRSKGVVQSMRTFRQMSSDMSIEQRLVTVSAAQQALMYRLSRTELKLDRIGALVEGIADSLKAKPIPIDPVHFRNTKSMSMSTMDARPSLMHTAVYDPVTPHRAPSGSVSVHKVEAVPGLLQKTSSFPGWSEQPSIPAGVGDERDGDRDHRGHRDTKESPSRQRLDTRHSMPPSVGSGHFRDSSSGSFSAHARIGSGSSWGTAESGSDSEVGSGGGPSIGAGTGTSRGPSSGVGSGGSIGAGSSGPSDASLGTSSGPSRGVGSGPSSRTGEGSATGSSISEASPPRHVRSASASSRTSSRSRTRGASGTSNRSGSAGSRSSTSNTASASGVPGVVGRSGGRVAKVFSRKNGRSSAWVSSGVPGARVTRLQSISEDKWNEMLGGGSGEKHPWNRNPLMEPGTEGPPAAAATAAAGPAPALVPVPGVDAVDDEPDPWSASSPTGQFGAPDSISGAPKR